MRQPGQQEGAGRAADRSWPADARDCGPVRSVTPGGERGEPACGRCAEDPVVPAGGGGASGAGQPGDVVIGSLCSGYGGLDIAVLAVLGGRLAWAADDDRHAAAVLAARFPEAANLGDITAIDWARVPPVDVLTAGFPCQDISSAGKCAGLTGGTRSAIWMDVVQAVRVLRPGVLLVENVATLRGLGLSRVLGDLAEAGYDALWRCVRASDAGAPHRRERVFLLAFREGDPPVPGAPPGLRRCGQRRPAGHAGGDGCPAAGGGGRAGSGAASHADRSADLAHAGGAHGLEAAAWQDAAVRLAGGGCPAGITRPRDSEEINGPGSRGRPGTPGDHPPAGDFARWGPCTQAIRRWERVLGLPAPVPAEPGGRRLRAGFVEWLMGLPPGFVTALDGIPRAAQLRVLGNGVVPAQASHALALLLADLHELRSVPGGGEKAA